MWWEKGHFYQTTGLDFHHDFSCYIMSEVCAAVTRMRVRLHTPAHTVQKPDVTVLKEKVEMKRHMQYKRKHTVVSLPPGL